MMTAIGVVLGFGACWVVFVGLPRWTGRSDWWESPRVHRTVGSVSAAVFEIGTFIGPLLFAAWLFGTLLDLLGWRM